MFYDFPIRTLFLVLSTLSSRYATRFIQTLRTQDKHTHFGQYEFMEMASSLPRLRTVRCSCNSFRHSGTDPPLGMEVSDTLRASQTNGFASALKSFAYVLNAVRIVLLRNERLMTRVL